MHFEALVLPLSRNPSKIGNLCRTVLGKTKVVVEGGKKE